MILGYARVSTEDQDLTLQLKALKKAGCKRIFEDKATGKNRDRPGLTRLMESAREGDILLVWRLSRLGRSVKDLIEITEELKEIGVHIKSLTESIDTSSPHGKLLFHIMAALAQLEREQIAENTRAGLAVARKRGKVGGRPAKITAPMLRDIKKRLSEDKDLTIDELALALNVKKNTIYQRLRRDGFSTVLR